MERAQETVEVGNQCQQREKIHEAVAGGAPEREWVHLGIKTIIEREKLTMQKRETPCRKEVHTWTRGRHKWRVRLSEEQGWPILWQQEAKRNRGVGVSHVVHLAQEA